MRARSIVPPYVLEAIVANGSDAQRERAQRTLVVDAVHRAARAGGAPEAAAAPAETPQRTISDAAGGTRLTGLETLRAEGEPPSGDAAADEAYDGLGATWTFYEQVFGRNSIDGAGLPLLGVVHYDRDYDNAFWDGSRMIFGDGDGELFVRFTRSLDVIGHELTHGVTEQEAGLEYQGESGALNESISDVFGSLVKQHRLDQTAEQADWLIGAEIRGPQFHGSALRSMTAPGTAYDDPVLGRDPQPADYAGFVHTTEDSGGVHINSGIPNRAFYLVASALGGNAWDAPGRIWYEALTNGSLPATATFTVFARATVRAAADLSGSGTKEHDAVRGAWETVGVKV
jgi:Zn-dependent metalloprotease